MLHYSRPILIAVLFGCSTVWAQQPLPQVPAASAPFEVGPTYIEAGPSTGPQFWARGEYVFWLIGTGKITEIIKESYQSDLFNGLLSLAGKDFKDVVQTALGNDRTGFRFNVGGWLDDERTLGLETSFLYANRGSLILPLGRGDRNPLARVTPNGELVLQRQGQFDPSFENARHPALAHLLYLKFVVPAIDDRTRKEVVIPYGNRNLVDANLTIDGAAKTFWSFDITGRANVMQSPFGRVDALLGYRRISYEDSLSIRTETDTLARPLLPGTRITTIDDVRTQNIYDGVLLGLDMEANYGPWSIALRPTATIAYLDASVQRDAGRQVSFPAQRRLNFAGGTYLRDTELGNFATSRWTIIPEVALRGSRSFGENVRVLLGGSMLYIPDVARAVNQLELGLDPTRLLPGGSPGIAQYRLSELPELRSMFMLTMTAGVEFRF